MSHFDEAFGTLLNRCIGCRPEDELLIIYDESFFPYFDSLTRVVLADSRRATFLHVPREYQLQLAERSRLTGDAVRLPMPLDAAMLPSTVIITALDAGRATAPLRQAILHHPRTGTCRLAHMPGITADILELLIRSPIEQIACHAEAVAWALGESSHAVLTTYNGTGEEFVLSLGMEAWDNEPYISSGVIDPGSWGNVPPGEAFCCPRPEQVSGRICINGSVPGIRLTSNEEVILTFENGKVNLPSPLPDTPAYAFLARECRKHSGSTDDNHVQFAELGIGLNPAIESLTGSPLFDEKAAGTVHIAIGDNSVFGHNIRASFHHDMVTCRPTLTLDGRTILDRGRICLDTIERWRLEPRSDIPLPNDTVIFLKPATVSIQNGRLRRRLHRAHRTGYISVSDSRTSEILAELCRELESYGRISVRKIQCAPTDGQSIAALVALLYHYRIVGIEPAD